MSLFDFIPGPWRLVSQIGAVLLVALSLYALGRYDGAAHVEARWASEKAVQMAENARLARLLKEREILENERVRKAESNAEMRQNQTRRQAADAAATVGRLRNDLAAARARLSAATAEACRKTAGAALELLGTCADEYRSVAEAADGHDSDVRTLDEAWPR